MNCLAHRLFRRDGQKNRSISLQPVPLSVKTGLCQKKFDGNPLSEGEFPMFQCPTFLSVTMLVIMICTHTYGQGGFGEADANRDAKVDAIELERNFAEKLPGFTQFNALFKELDADKDGSLSEKEFANRMEAARKIMAGQPGTNRQPGAANRRNARQRPAGLKIGDVAPTFQLKSLDGKAETDLDSFKGKKPVVLIFGSYT